MGEVWEEEWRGEEIVNLWSGEQKKNKGYKYRIQRKEVNISQVDKLGERGRKKGKSKRKKDTKKWIKRITKNLLGKKDGNIIFRERRKTFEKA